MKEIKNKTVVIVIALVVVVLIGVLLLTQCGKEETGREKEQSGSKEPGKEFIIDEKEDKDGLTVGTPEDADKEQQNNQVEFVGPGNASDDNSDGKTNANGADNTDVDGGIEDKTEKDEIQKDESNEDNADEDKDTGNLDEEKDSTGQYGEFF